MKNDKEKFKNEFKIEADLVNNQTKKLFFNFRL